jgi:hypothetical protein
MEVYAISQMPVALTKQPRLTFPTSRHAPRQRDMCTKAQCVCSAEYAGQCIGWYICARVHSFAAPRARCCAQSWCSSDVGVREKPARQARKVAITSMCLPNVR